MADLSITSSDVIKGSGARVTNGTAGAAIAAGDTVYIDASDSDKIKLADANASSATATMRGIALHAAAVGQPIAFQTEGDITLGNVLTAGKVYVLSANAGKIAPVADLTTGWRTSIVGVAVSATVLRMSLLNTDVANA